MLANDPEHINEFFSKKKFINIIPKSKLKRTFKSTKYVKKVSLAFTLFLSISCLSGCSTPVTTTLAPSTEVAQKATKDSIIKNYTGIVLASYQDSLQAVKTLQQDVNKFLANPSKENLESAKSSWLKARLPYGQTEAYKFYDGPIDTEDSPGKRIDPSPLDETAIDYVDGNKSAGIINDTKKYPDITKNMIIELNQKEGEKNNILGFHAVEFLLWGQDLTDGPGGGQRTYTDYLTVGKASDSSQVRRAKYLNIVTDMLVEDMQKVVDEWDPAKANNYLASVNKMNTDDVITKILKGIGTLSASELPINKMGMALDSGEREQETSCDSDSTQIDLMQNAKGIQNVLTGTYTRTDGTTVKGTGIYELMLAVKPELAIKLKNHIESSLYLIEQIKNPFDQEIRADNKSGNTRVKAALNSLQSEGVSIVESGYALGLTINTEE